MARRYTQPQNGPAQIDWSNPITRGLTASYCGASGGYNAATGKSDAVSVGGTGYTKSTVAFGNSVKTSAASGWASIAVNQDWSGPNTILLLSVFNTITSAWGGIFSKISSGTETQIGAGRNNTGNTIYIGVSAAIANPVAGSSISQDIGKQSVNVFTHTGVASTGGLLYHNGVLVGSTTNLGIQASGTGPLILGNDRSATSPLASGIDFGLVLRFNRVLSPAEIAPLSANPWQIFKSISQSAIFGVTPATPVTAVTGSLLGFGPIASLPLGGLPAAGGGTTNYSLVGDNGTYSVAGQVASVQRTKVLLTSAGFYSVAGVTSILQRSKVLTATAGSYAVTGQTAIILYTAAANNYVVSALAGSYSVAGISSSIARSRLISSVAGSYAIGGVASSITRTRLLDGSTGSYTYSGVNASLLRSKVVSSSAGSYAISGKTATIVWASAGGGVWPLPSQVAYGVVYGPTGSDYTGTFLGNMTLEIETGQLIKPLTPKLSIML